MVHPNLQADNVRKYFFPEGIVETTVIFSSESLNRQRRQGKESERTR